MIKIMKWEKLLSRKRLFTTDKEYHDDRSPFLIDADRIVFSQAFRRMQDKTQVHPLSKSDSVRTRLTHSIEASSVGRSLGFGVGQKVIEKYKLNNITSHDFSNIIQAACLAHDIGNPPFGHLGEAAIIDFFKKEGSNYLDNLEDKQKDNLKNFDGNAQGFRIINHLSNLQNEGGLKLTCATLGAFTKYPNGSTAKSQENKDYIGSKKIGFFETEKAIFEEIAENLGLIKTNESTWKRHPLAFLVEAADDISYTIADIDDAVKVKIISFEEAENILAPLAIKNTQNYDVYNHHKILNSLNEENENYKELTQQNKLSFLTGKSIGNMIASTIDTFMHNHDEILAGDFNNDLLSLTPYGDKIKECKDFARKNIFESGAKLETEIAGFEVIKGLLEEFCYSLNDDSAKSKKLRILLGEEVQKTTKMFEKIITITDKISAMTDYQTIDIYRKIKGISF